MAELVPISIDNEILFRRAIVTAADFSATLVIIATITMPINVWDNPIDSDAWLIVLTKNSDSSAANIVKTNKTIAAKRLVHSGLICSSAYSSVISNKCLCVN